MQKVISVCLAGLCFCNMMSHEVRLIMIVGFPAVEQNNTFLKVTLKC